MPQDRLPIQVSPLAKHGKSLDVRSVNCAGGVLTLIDDYLRPPNKAKRIRNFHQFTRGVFSSGGGGWQRDNAAGLNGGAVCLDFGVYVDALGAQFLLAQFGSKVYSYNTTTHAGTALGAPLDAANATALPCIRPASPTAQTTNPFAIYCNGKIEPQKIYNATAGAAPNTVATLGFNNGFFTETVTIGGTIAAGDTVKLTLTNASGNTPLTLSPYSITYTVLAGDTTSTVALGLAKLINADANAAVAGFTATSAATVVTINFPVALNGLVTFAKAVTGVITATLAAGSTTPVWPGVFNGLTYTKPALCTPFRDRVAYVAFDNAGASGNAVANQLLISSASSSESFRQSVPPQATDAWSVPIPPIAGTPRAITSFRPLTNLATEVIIIGCDNGMFIVSGTDATNFNIQIQSLQFGIPSNRTFVQLDNSLLFMATDGFRQYNGSSNTANLLTDTLSLDFYDEFMKIDRTAWLKSHAVHHRDTQEVWFWVPYTGEDGDPTHGDNGSPKHAFIMNYNSLDGSPIWYFKDNTTCMASIEFNHTFYGGNDVGLVQKWYGCNNYDDVISAVGGAANVIPGSEVVLACIGVGNPAQLCSIQNVVVGCSENDQKFLINAAAYEIMDNGATRKQPMQPINYTLQSATAPQTVLGPASPSAWTLDSSAFPSAFSKFLTGYVPLGHARLWEFSLTCNDSSHNLDFTFLQPTISLGGQRI